jgi:KDO2-lipid IV(A) lauroyltransferase
MAVAAVNARGPKLETFGEYLVYLVFRVLEELFCLVPQDKTALSLGRFCGRLMFIFGRERRQVAIKSLSLAFGAERSATEIRTIALRNFEHLGMLGVEFFRIRRWDQNTLAEKLVFEGCGNFNAAWLPGGPGRLYIAAHTGSFEVLAAASKFVGMKGSLVVTPAPNRFVNERMFFRRGGEESGLHILPHKAIVRRVIDRLRGGEMVVVLADQRGDDSRPIWVDFFRERVLANGVFAKFAIEGNASVHPVIAIRTEDGHYRCIFEQEIPVQVTGDMQADLTVNSQRFHRKFEDWLRQYPEQGFWMHRKFRRKERRGPKLRFQALLESRAQLERAAGRGIVER